MTSKVYWCARDLDGSPWGNHHFILVVQGTPKITSTMGVKWQSYAGTEFMTIAAFAKKKGGSKRLLVGYNDATDVHSVKEILNPKMAAKQWSDYDLEKHEVKPPSGKTIDSFVKDILVRAEIYKKKEAKKNIPYSLVDENCACWVNSVFKVCGVSKSTRKKAGEFSGVDWGEEDEIDASYFK